MKKLLLLTCIVFVLAQSVSAATYYLRPSGGTTTQCTGLANADYDGSGTGEACAWSAPADAFATATCGDTIKALADATFTGVWTLSDNCAAGSPITLTSTATLPSRRILNTDEDLLPKFKTNSGSAAAVFTFASNAGGWVLDGLDLSDDAGTNGINALISAPESTNHDLTIDRIYFHQKETGTTYTRSVIRAVILEGSNHVYKRSWIYIIGYPYGGSTEPHNSAAFVSVGGPGPITFTDNYVKTWYVGFFLGGGDTGAQNTATLTSASTTSATFSNVSGLQVGTFIRFSVPGTATLSNAGGTPTLTRLTGEAWVAADGNHNGNWGDSCFITSVADPTKFGITRLMTLTGDNVFTTTAANSSVTAIPNGTVDYIIYQTAKVTNIAGSVVTYDPLGTTAGINYATNSLQHTPTAAAWNNGDQGLIVDVDVTYNNFNIDVDFAVEMRSIGRGCPKGTWEIKNAKRFLFDRNLMTGYPGTMGATAANQNGSAPWITFDEATFTNNYWNFDDYPDCNRELFLFSDDAYLNTITPTTTLTFTNNLVTRGVRLLGTIKNGDIWTITHNTILNDSSSVFATNAFMSNGDSTPPAAEVKNNIGFVVCYGFGGYPTGWTGTTILKNILIDSAPGCSGGIGVNTYGTNSAIAPIPDAISDLGFVSGTYQLSGGSAYHNAGSDGTDPGIVWNTAGAPWLTSSLVGSRVLYRGTLRGPAKIR